MLLLAYHLPTASHLAENKIQSPHVPNTCPCPSPRVLLPLPHSLLFGYTCLAFRLVAQPPACTPTNGLPNVAPSASNSRVEKNHQVSAPELGRQLNPGSDKSNPTMSREVWLCPQVKFKQDHSTVVGLSFGDRKHDRKQVKTKP